jgi:thiol-disulfide isomerase/thioredoxin
MKIAISQTFFAFLITACALYAEQFHVGSPVSDFQVVDVQGASHSFASLKGDTTVVIFISTQCPVSNAYNRRMEYLYEYYSPKGVKFVFVNANVNESSRDVANHAKQVGFAFPVYRDSGNVADLFNAQVTPETYVIDKAGILRYHGSIDDSQNEARIKKRSLRAALDEVLAGKPVTVAETKAFGCTVKRARHAQTD